MADDQNTDKPVRAESAYHHPLPDGSGLLFDQTSQTAYPITESARLIWELCDGEHDFDQIVSAVETKYDVNRETAENDAKLLLADLREKGLLADRDTA
jgi:hypothetical protein